MRLPHYVGRYGSSEPMRSTGSRQNGQHSTHALLTVRDNDVPTPFARSADDGSGFCEQPCDDLSSQGKHARLDGAARCLAA